MWYTASNSALAVLDYCSNYFGLKTTVLILHFLYVVFFFIYMNTTAEVALSVSRIDRIDESCQENVTTIWRGFNKSPKWAPKQSIVFFIKIVIADIIATTIVFTHISHSSRPLWTFVPSFQKLGSYGIDDSQLRKEIVFKTTQSECGQIATNQRLRTKATR